MMNSVIPVLAAVLFGAAVILLVWGAFSVFPRVSRPITKSFWCPFLARDVTAQFEEEAWDGTPVDVSSCTAFTPPTAITCKKLCLHMEKLEPRKEEQAA